MGSRTIYVADRDEELFARAAELAGGLSPAIATALRSYVEREEAAVHGYDEITVKTGDGWGTRTATFFGRRLARLALPSGNGRVVRYDLYRTQREQIAVHVSDSVDWARTAEEDSPIWDDPATWNADWYRPGPRTLEVFASPDDIGDRLPAPVVEAAREALQQPVSEYLDI